MRVIKKPSLFHSRLVIAIPSWGVFVVAGAAALAIFDRLAVVTELVSLACCFFSLVCVWVARRMVKELRYQMHEIINDIGNEDLPEPEAETAEVFSITDRKSG